MIRFLLICLGGALGTGARYLLQQGAVRALGLGFPYGTLAANALGSFLICVVVKTNRELSWLSPTMYMAITTGVMGGFTTYSSLNQDTLNYFEKGAHLLAAANLFGNLVICMAFALLGLHVARWLVGS